jgi:caffeoyl-CoA O-methyltransferase
MITESEIPGFRTKEQIMFHDIPPAMRARMQEMEARDAIDRADGTAKMQRLRQVPPETGRFLALLCAGAPAGRLIEIGASGGYSALWLSLACRLRGDRLITYELLEEKVVLARVTFQAAGVEKYVQVLTGDAREKLAESGPIAFCFLDAEKDVYLDCYELVVPRLVPGGLLVVDNLISHAGELVSFQEHVLRDPRVDALLVPIGKGELVCRKI